MTTCYSVSKCKYISFTRIDPKVEGLYLTESTLNEMFDKIDNFDVSKYEVVNIVINSESSAFSDIHFNVDERKVEMNSETLKQDILSGGTLGSSQMLDAIATNSFAINAGRKGANIPNVHIQQNHDTLDAIAANGLLNSPCVMSANSVGKLLLRISEKFNNFNIYILNSSLKVDKFDGVAPSTYNVPRYAVGHGEILSVFFRYISLLFYGYMTVNEIQGDTDYDRIYDI